MPNHITNILKINGDEELVEKIKSEIIGDVDYSNPDKYVEEMPIDFNKIIPMPDGNTDWYSWCIDKWGTKWNAYSQEVGLEGEIIFQTAWSNPYPIIEALSNKYPDAEFNLRYADEDFGQNVGEYSMKDGEVTYEDIPEEGSEEALVLAVEITGWEDYISDRCLEIDPEYSVEDLDDYDKKWISIAYKKDVLDNYPKCVLDYMLELAVEDENYEFAQKIKDTTSWYEPE